MLSHLKAAPEAISEMERRLRVTDGILRFLTVRIDEQQAKLERRRVHKEDKEQARRARRAARATVQSEPPAGAPTSESTAIAEAKNESQES